MAQLPAMNLPSAPVVLARLRSRHRVPALAVVATVVALLAQGLGGAHDAAAEEQTATVSASCEVMTLRQRAAQTVAAGLPGTTASSTARKIVRADAGTVILMGHNITGRTQLKTMIRDLRSVAPYRLLVASDEEGGRVSRLDDYGLVHHVPAARWLGDNATEDNVRWRGKRLGREMKDLGVNWNFAPVYDVSSTAWNSVIGDRSYSGQPRKVVRYGRAFATGLRRGGVNTTAKHFPGHGRTTTDSHTTLPTINVSRKTLWETDLLPFRKAKKPLTAMMTAHVAYPGLDIHGPASLSRKTYRLMRRDVGFNGVAITDALGMGAVSSRYSTPEAAEKAIRAGADIALTTEWDKAAPMTDRLVNAVRNGRLPRARINQAANRVLRAKGYTAEQRACRLGG